MSTPTEVQINHDTGLCRITEGEARRVFYTTTDAVGLRMLGLTAPSHTANLPWMDCLATRGMAIGMRGDSTFVLWTVMPTSRQLTWRRHGESHDLTITFPPLLFGLKFHHGSLGRSSLYVIKPGLERRLSVDLRDPVLCPFPYGNVYDHGGICWGEINLRDIHQPQEAEDAFFQSGFNGDLFYGASIGAREATLPEVMRRIGAVPVPPPVNGHYRSSVQGMVTSLGR